MKALTAQVIADGGELEVLGDRLPDDSKQACAEKGVVPPFRELCSLADVTAHESVTDTWPANGTYGWLVHSGSDKCAWLFSGPVTLSNKHEVAASGGVEDLGLAQGQQLVLRLVARDYRSVRCGGAVST